MVSWPLVSLVIVIAAATWGLYAWRNLESPFERATVSADSNEENPSGELVSLRATRPSVSANPAQDTSMDAANEPDLPGTPSGTVNVNAPPASLEPVEMTLAKSALEEPAPPLEAVPAIDPLDRARSLVAGGKLLAARDAFSAALRQSLPASAAREAREELTRLSAALLFSRAANTNDPLTDVRIVQPGNTIYEIAKEYGITEELVMSINGVTEPNRLRVGDRLKVLRGPFSAIISKSAHRMDVYLGEQLVRSYRVGLGVNGGTPTGSWIVVSKLKNPDWTDPVTNQYYLAEDPDNPIGERWVGLEGRSGEAVGRMGFGIHGTIDPASIGENMSMGCIRMTAEDVEEVYDLLVEHRSPVVINP